MSNVTAYKVVRVDGNGVSFLEVFPNHGNGFIDANHFYNIEVGQPYNLFIALIEVLSSHSKVIKQYSNEGNEQLRSLRRQLDRMISHTDNPKEHSRHNSS